MKRAALYLRVSTRDQTTENQSIELRRVAQARNWDIVAIYEDEGISGAKGRETRHAYDRLLKDAVRSKFDVVMAWDVSRLGRSLNGLVQALDDFHANKVDLYLHQQALDTTTASGKAMFQMCGVFAEFERAMISERIRAGLSRARAVGIKLGRPNVIVDQEAFFKDLLSGISIREAAKRHKVSVGKAHALSKARVVDR